MRSGEVIDLTESLSDDNDDDGGGCGGGLSDAGGVGGGGEMFQNQEVLPNLRVEIDLSADDEPPTSGTCTQVDEAAPILAAWSWYNPAFKQWWSFTAAHSRLLDQRWQQFAESGRAFEGTRLRSDEGDVFSVDLNQMTMRHVNGDHSAETRIRRVETRPSQERLLQPAVPSSCSGAATAPVLSEPAKELCWCCTDAACAAVHTAGRNRGETIEEKERQLRLSLQVPRLQLIKRAGAGGSDLGYSGHTNALCIDLDPEEPLGSLRNLQSSLHLLRCDVSRGAAQIRPVLNVLQTHLARTEPHVDVADDDIEQSAVVEQSAQKRRVRSNALHSAAAGAARRDETVHYWERASLPAYLRQEESAIRQALFDTLLELLPLLECRKSDAKDAFETLSKGMQLAEAEMIEQAVAPGVMYGGILFFAFAVEQLCRHGPNNLVSVMTADCRKQLLDKLVHLTMVETRLTEHHELLMQSIGRSIALVARCDMTDLSLAPDRVCRGVTGQVRLMPLAEELYRAVFVCGSRSSRMPEHVAKWLPMQQRFITTVQSSCPLLALLVLDLRLSPGQRMQRLWSRLARWEHMSGKVSQTMLEGSRAVDEYEMHPAAGHMWLLASFYSAALELVCDLSSPWTLEEVKQCVAAERAQDLQCAWLQHPFENPARQYDDLVQTLQWSTQHTTGTRLQLALEGIHAAFLHA